MNLTQCKRLSVLVIALLWVGGCAPMTITLNTDGPQGLKSKIVEHDETSTSNRIAIIDISGMLINAHRSQLLGSGVHPVSRLHEKLEEARKDKYVKAIILRLNTPGGTVTASDLMYRQILRFKKRSGKPVIVLMMDVAASGGYYIACAGDHIVAYPSTVTGSIGVILQTISFKPLMDKIGIEAEALTSGPNKAAGSPFTSLKDEHRKILRSMVDRFYQQFRTIVKNNRPNIPAGQLDTVTDGRVFAAEDALKVGLVDQIGDVYDAWQVAKIRAGVKYANLVFYHRPLASPASPFAAAPGATPKATQINFAQFNFPNLLIPQHPGFYYLWMPTP